MGNSLLQNIGDETCSHGWSSRLNLSTILLLNFPFVSRCLLTEKKGTEIVSGEQRAVKIKIGDQVVWVRGGQEERIKSNGNFFSINLTKNYRASLS